MFFPISSWIAAFLVTVAVETPIVVAGLRRTEPDLARLGVFIGVANLATHLAVWYVFTQLLLVGTWQYLLVAEAWAMSVEAVLYWAAIRGLSVGRAIAVAVVANAASFLTGRLLGAVWPDLFG